MSQPKIERRGRIPGAPLPDPWRPAHYENEDAYAVKAVMHGTASEEQQRRAMHFIVHALCGTYDASYRPSSDRDTAFAEGKRFVGLQLVKFSQLNVAALRGSNTEQGDTPKEPK